VKAARIRNLALRDQIEATVRENGPLTAKEVSKILTGRSYADPWLLRMLGQLENHALVTGFRQGAGQQVLWAAAGPPAARVEDVEAIWRATG
jgi:hypothetical protein